MPQSLFTVGFMAYGALAIFRPADVSLLDNLQENLTNTVLVIVGGLAALFFINYIIIYFKFEAMKIIC